MSQDQPETDYGGGGKMPRDARPDRSVTSVSPLRATVTVLVAASMLGAGAVAVLAFIADPGLGGGRATTSATVGPTTTPSHRDEITAYRDAAYEPGKAFAPTSGKSQAKLWFYDGHWWAVMLDATTTSFHIFMLDGETQEWADTGTVVDSRLFARSDALSDGDHLYIISGGPAEYRSHAVQLRRYSYITDEKRYLLDESFPVAITETGVKSVTLTKASDGTLWIAYILANDRVHVNHTDGDDARWVGGFVLPTTGTVVAADEVAVLAYADRVGVVWSNQNVSAVFFTSHQNNAPSDDWEETSTAIEGLDLADDHISAKAVEDESGTTIYSAVKTSLDDLANPNPLDPQILLLALDPNGEWHRYIVARIIDRHTRPVLLVNPDRRELYVFMTSPYTGGSIYYKKSSMDDISFDPGLGAPFITSPIDRHINNATSTKQDISDESGIVVLAADDKSGRYVHGTIAGDRPTEQGAIR